MQHLFSAWPEVAHRLDAAGHLMLLSDYDGTLTPIVERPELAELPMKTRRLLQRVAGRHNVTVGIISGRALSDLRSRVGLEGIIYAGNHGLEIEGPGLRFVNPLAEEVKPLLRLLHLGLLQALSAVRGVLVENKGLTLTVHYRQVEPSQSWGVRGAVESVVAPSRDSGQVRITTGKKVYEVRPAVDWDKGKAIELLWDRYGRRQGIACLPLYVGDDLTDEDGFRAVKAHGGISIFVGGPDAQSRAQYFLESPQEVQRFLELMLGLR